MKQNEYEIFAHIICKVHARIKSVWSQSINSIMSEVATVIMNNCKLYLYRKCIALKACFLFHGSYFIIQNFCYGTSSKV